MPAFGLFAVFLYLNKISEGCVPIFNPTVLFLLLTLLCCLNYEDLGCLFCKNVISMM